jgi:hypothetical protein
MAGVRLLPSVIAAAAAGISAAAAADPSGSKTKPARIGTPVEIYEA